MSQLAMFIKSADKGENLLINSLNISNGEIFELRKLIKEGVVTPDEKILRKYFKEEELPKYKSGEAICPYMTYTKL